MTDIEDEAIEQPEAEEVVEAVEADDGAVEADVSEDAGLVVEIGGDDEEADGEVVWRRNMRDRIKELTAKVKEYEAKAAAPAEMEQLPPKPRAEDFDYDHEAHAEAVEKWTLLKVEHEKRQAEHMAVQEQAEQRWQSRLAYYEEAKDKLGVADMDEAEAVVSEILAAPFPGIMAEDVRIGIIKQVAKDPAKLVYALSQNAKAARDLAQIEDPATYAYTLGVLETTMKEKPRAKAPPPEKRVSGGVPGVAGALDDTYERLFAEAQKTGDLTKLRAYKRQTRG